MGNPTQEKPASNEAPPPSETSTSASTEVARSNPAPAPETPSNEMAPTEGTEAPKSNPAPAPTNDVQVPTAIAHAVPAASAAAAGYVAGVPTATAVPVSNAAPASMVSMPRAFTLHIKRGKDLYNTDWMKPFSKLDPYCIVNMAGSEKCRTAIMKNIGVNPQFNFSHPMSWNGETNIEFVVMDKDTFTADDLVGEASLDMRAVQNGWSGLVNLVREGGKAAGQIEVEFVWQQPLPSEIATEVSRGVFTNVPSQVVAAAAPYAPGSLQHQATTDDKKEGGMSKGGMVLAAVGVVAAGALLYSATSGSGSGSGKKGGKDKKDKKGGKDKKDKKGKKNKSHGPGMGGIAMGVAGVAAAGGAAYYAQQQGMFGERGIEGEFQERGLDFGGESDSSSGSTSSDDRKKH